MRTMRIVTALSIAATCGVVVSGTASADPPAHVWEETSTSTCQDFLFRPVAQAFRTTGSTLAVGISTVTLESATATETVTMEIVASNEVKITKAGSETVWFEMNGDGYMSTVPKNYTIIGTGTFTEAMVCLEGTPKTPPAPELAMVVGEDVPLAAGDVPIHALADAIGEVTLVDDNALATTDLSGFDAVLLSSSVNVVTVGSQLKSLGLPLVTWEAFLHKANGLTGDTGETASKYRTIRVTNDAHPIAAGLSGVVPVTSKSAQLSFARVPASASVVASVPNRAGQAVVFTYDEGDQLADGSSAADCRVGLFPNYFGARWLTTDGATIVSAAIEWALDCAAPAT